jgi:hypothetical protein
VALAILIIAVGYTGILALERLLYYKFFTVAAGAGNRLNLYPLDKRLRLLRELTDFEFRLLFILILRK